MINALACSNAKQRAWGQVTRVKFHICADLPFPCEDKFNQHYHEYDHDRRGQTVKGNLLGVYEFELEAIEKPVVVKAQDFAAGRVVGTLSDEDTSDEE